MTRRFFPGAWYCDALPSGAFAVLWPKVGIETHLGSLPLPPGETFGPLYLRCTEVDLFRFAGQAHDGTNPAAYEWRNYTGWRALPPPCCGQSPLIYDRLGVLHLSDCSIGSQGWRFCQDDGTPEGHLVTGDATYGPFHGLSEYTALGDELWIGQGHEAGGVLVFDGTALRVLETGDGRFVRANREGERVAVAFVKSDGAVIVQTTMTELRNLRLLTAGIDHQPGPVANASQPPPLAVIVKESPMSLPSLDTWLHEELPQLVAAFHKTHPGTPTPDDWYAFQTYRRFVEPDAWPFDRMLQHEQGDDSVPVNPR